MVKTPKLFMDHEFLDYTDSGICVICNWINFQLCLIQERGFIRGHKPMNYELSITNYSDAYALF